MKRAAFLFVALLLPAPLLVMHESAAQTTDAHPPTYDGAAVADGVRVNVSAPGYAIVEEFVDSGAPVAQAVFDSTGRADGIASTPYPGALALSVSPTATGSAGLPSAPPYPLMATSSPQEPEQHVDAPGYSLSAKTTDTSVSSNANAGNDDPGQAAGSSKADASVAFGDDGDSLVSVAHTTSTGFRLGSFVTVGAVHSSASATGRPGQPVELASDLSVDGLSLLGTPVEVTPQGLVAGSQVTPVSLDAILSQLASNGVTVTVVKPVETDDGVTAGGLAITYSAKSSVPDTPAVTTTTMTLGRAMARASASGEVAASSSAFPSVGTGTLSNPSGSALAAVSSPRGTGAVSRPASRPAKQSAASSTFTTRPARAPGVVMAPLPVWGLYLIIVVAAFAIAGCTQLVRLFGVKLWIS